MQKESTSRAELMASFKALQRDFDNKKNDIKNKESDFDQLRKRFCEQLKQRNERFVQLIGSENPLQSLAYNLSGQLEKNFDNWEQQAAARSKGIQFRKDFGDSLLVFIYGKVKSGKSSLGNYMAWGHSEPTPELKEKSLSPTYFSAEQTNVASGDQDKEAEKTLQFRVNATEATSSIQGFKLPGLTWVDSPGLHSVNAKNGDLAKEYAEHADLILYTMSSQAPGRASDMEEITELLNSNKKIMVLLTGSDTTNEDEDEEGNLVTMVVMKDLLDRRDQVEYVNGELEQLQNSSSVLAEVLPISTRYAERNMTPEGIAESGMGRLMYELQVICASQALSIKLNMPMENLRHSIRVTADDLAGMREIISGFANSIGKQNDDLQRELSSLGVQGSSQMRAYINQVFIDEHADLENALRQKASEIISQLAIEALNKIGERQQQGLKQAFDSSRLSGIPEYREITEEKEYFVGTREGNKSLWGLGGTLLGGAAGFLLGGPAGAAIGASVGSASSMVGRSASAEYGRHQVVVSDNREEQRQAAIENYSNILPRLLDEHVNTLYGPLRTAMLEYCGALDRDMTELMDNLENLAQVNQ
ncbi:dynamin family protein [Halomonas sp. Bachu 37]|uniref:dynamin family protein n=1 Tax=Halomonas kashgarensis TaxID=3084920 RepID=UPI003217CA1B